MTDCSSKRIAIRFCTAEAITTIEELPRGFKSMIVEHAFNTYLHSDAGENLLAQLKKRKASMIRDLSKPQPKKRAVKAKLRSDEKTDARRLIGDF